MGTSRHPHVPLSANRVFKYNFRRDKLRSIFVCFYKKCVFVFVLFFGTRRLFLINTLFLFVFRWFLSLTSSHQWVQWCANGTSRPASPGQQRCHSRGNGTSFWPLSSDTSGRGRLRATFHHHCNNGRRNNCVQIGTYSVHTEVNSHGIVQAELSLASSHRFVEPVDWL